MCCQISYSLFVFHSWKFKLTQSQLLHRFPRAICSNPGDLDRWQDASREDSYWLSALEKITKHTCLLRLTFWVEFVTICWYRATFVTFEYDKGYTPILGIKSGIKQCDIILKVTNINKKNNSYVTKFHVE